MNKAKANTFAPAASVREFPLQSSSTTCWIIFLFALTAGFLLVLYHSTHTPTYTIDSYFYLSKAKQLLAGKGLTTSWNNGQDPKYFPGYSLVLAAAGALGTSYVSVQLIAYVLSAVLLVVALRELNISPLEHALAATAFSVNPIVIKWYSLPMAEGVALALFLAATVLFLRSLRTKRSLLLWAACALGGFAVITRIETLFLLLLFAPLVYRERRSINLPSVAAGAMIFFLPLFAYWIGVRSSAGEGPAYVQEFLDTLSRFNLLKNIMYNIWIPFGLMQHWPSIKHSFSLQMNLPIFLASAVWLFVGGAFFWNGLCWGSVKKMGSPARAAVLLFLAYAVAHGLWYYRYERFMLLALPIAAFIWAAFASFFMGRVQQRTGRDFLPVVQVMLVAAGLTLGYLFSSFHADSLQWDTSRLRFREIAQTINDLNQSQSLAVLTDLGPHLAYYLDAHSYLDDYHGNYWQPAFAPEQTLESLEKLRIGLIVTRQKPGRWLEEHKIPPDMVSRFQVIPGSDEGVTIIKYIPASLIGS